MKTGREKLRVVSGNVGGAFGMKIFLYPEQPAVVWAARRLEARGALDRGTQRKLSFRAQGRDNWTIVELGTDHGGAFCCVAVTTWANMGAYLSNFGPFIPQLAAPMLSGVYKIGSIFLGIKGTLTNTVPVDAYRGAGRPEAIYLLERTIDIAASSGSRRKSLGGGTSSSLPTCLTRPRSRAATTRGISPGSWSAPWSGRIGEGLRGEGSNRRPEEKTWHRGRHVHRALRRRAGRYGKGQGRFRNGDGFLWNAG